jgi:hypothetical protein
LEKMPPPPQVGRATQTAHLRVVDGTLAHVTTRPTPISPVNIAESCMNIKPNPDMVGKGLQSAHRP